MFEFYLLGILLFMVLSIVISSLFIGISPMPSSKKVANEILSLAKESNHEVIMDLGSGFGSLAIFLSVQLPYKKVIGYELSFFPWLVSMCLKYLLNVKNVHFYRKNFLNQNIKNTLLVCYLFPKGMHALEKKLLYEKEDFELISSTFAFRNIKEKAVIQTSDLYRTPVYYYLDVSNVNETA